MEKTKRIEEILEKESYYYGGECVIHEGSFDDIAKDIADQMVTREKVEKAINETLVVENKDSIKYTLDRIFGKE